MIHSFSKAMMWHWGNKVVRYVTFQLWAFVFLVIVQTVGGVSLPLSPFKGFLLPQLLQPEEAAEFYPGFFILQVVVRLTTAVVALSNYSFYHRRTGVFFVVSLATVLCLAILSAPGPCIPIFLFIVSELI